MAGKMHEHQRASWRQRCGLTLVVGPTSLKVAAVPALLVLHAVLVTVVSKRYALLATLFASFLLLVVAGVLWAASKLGLGPRVRVAISIHAKDISFALRDVTVDANGMLGSTVAGSLPLPMALVGLSARELGVAFCIWAGALELRSDGLRLSLDLLDPKHWDEAAARIAGRCAVLAQIEAKLQALTKACVQPDNSLQSTDVAPAAKNTMEGAKSPPVSTRMIDAIIGRVSLRTENFALQLEGGARDVAPGCSSALCMGVGSFHLPRAFGVNDIPGRVIAARWCRAATVERFFISLRRAAPSGANAACEAHSPVYFLAPHGCTLSLTLPYVMRELLSGRPEPLRRIDVDIGLTTECEIRLDHDHMAVLFGILGRRSSPSPWTLVFTDDAVWHGRGLASTERTNLVDRFKSGGKLTPKPEELADIKCADLLALKLWAASGPAALEFDPLDDDAWAGGVPCVWRRGEQAIVDPAWCKSQAPYHELSLNLSCPASEIFLGGGQASIRSQGTNIVIELLPTATRIQLAVAKHHAIEARPPGTNDDRQMLIQSSLRTDDPKQSHATRPAFALEVNLPSDGPMHVKTGASESTVQVLPGHFMYTLLPQLTCLTDSDPVPAAPDVKNLRVVLQGDEIDVAADTVDGTGTAEASPGDAQSLAPLAFLGGMLIEVDVNFADCGLHFPGTSSGRGLSVQASSFSALLSSSPVRESARVEVDGSTINVSGNGVQVLRPMEMLSLGYEVSWDVVKGGPLLDANVLTPYADVVVSHAFMKMARKCGERLSAGLEDPRPKANSSAPVDNGADNASPCADSTTADARLRSLFEQIDADASGTLERAEMFHLVEQLCHGEHSLSRRELTEAFEDIWAIMDVSNDGLVTFEEFCHACDLFRHPETPAGQEESALALGSLNSSTGHLIVYAGSLACTDIVTRVSTDDEHLWTYLLDEIGLRRQLHGGTGDSVRVLQLKMLRALRNFDEAKRLWTSTVSAFVAPDAPWEINPDTPFYSASATLGAALGGHLIKGSAEGPSDVVEELVTGKLVGYKVCVRVRGCVLGLSDTLTQLRGQTRLAFGIGNQARHADEYGLNLHTSYWHAIGGSHFGEDDSLECDMKLRDVSGWCLNPVRQGTDPILENWGMAARVSTAQGDRALVIHLVSDQHLVTNVTSSLFLAMKPVLETLFPPHVGDVPELPSTCLSTAPLDHLLRGVGHLTTEDLVAHKLKGVFADTRKCMVGCFTGGGYLLRAPRSRKVNFTRSMQGKHPNVTFVVELPPHVAILRIEAPAPWDITDIRWKRTGVLEVTIYAQQISTATRTALLASAGTAHQSEQAPDEPAVDVFVCDRSVATEVHSARRKPRKLHRLFSGTNRSKLMVVNFTGQSGKLWFEDPSSGDKLECTSFDAEEITCTVPDTDAPICLQIEGEAEEMRPELATVGRYAVPFDGPNGFVRDPCLCTSLAIDEKGVALLQVLPPLELKNTTSHPLLVTLRPPHGQPSATPIDEHLGPGQVMQVPLRALRDGCWTVSTLGMVAHAFPLSQQILQRGTHEATLRRSLGLALQTHTIPPSARALRAGDSRCFLGGFGETRTTTLRRYTLCLLPGLRVHNVLPYPLQVTFQRQGYDAADKRTSCLAEDHRVEPGASLDFGLVDSDCHIKLKSHAGEIVEFSVPAEALRKVNKFCETSRDIDLGSLRCSLQAKWLGGRAPEYTICCTHVVFNKTGLPIMLRVAKSSCQMLVDKDKDAVLRASNQDIEVKVMDLPDFPSGSMALPQHSGNLQLRLWADGGYAVYEWVAHVAVLSEGRLAFERDGAPTWHWKLSIHTEATVVDAATSAGEAFAFRVADPGRSFCLMLSCTSASELKDWVQALANTVHALQAQASISNLSAGWDADAYGQCQVAAVPSSARGTWSKEIPVQAPGEGEVCIEASATPASSSFLGVRVHPLVGTLSRSTGITLTPRFVVRNQSNSFVQVLPALLPADERKWNQAQHAALAALHIEQLSGQRRTMQTPGSGRSLYRMTTATPPNSQLGGSQISVCREDGAVWVPPGGSVALVQFPRWCRANEVSMGRKAVSLRLPGRAQLQVMSLESGKELPLEKVGASFMPYRDAFSYLGSLPQCLRTLAKEGRLWCMRSLDGRGENHGELSITTEAVIILAIREGAGEEAAQPALLQASGWQMLPERLDLRHRGHSVGKFQLFRRHVEPGQLCLDGTGKGSVIFWSRQPIGANCPTEFGADTGLPWSRWVRLDATGEDRRAMYGEDGSHCFLRCSVQVEQSTAFLVLSHVAAPYRVDNRSPTRTLALRFEGSVQCHVLSPLSWWSFDWPVEDTKRRLLIVQDVASHRREMYDTDTVGPGRPISLTEGVSLTGATAPLNEEGYRAVVLCLDTKEMAEFVQRVITHMDGPVNVQHDKLASIAQQHSGEESSQSYRALCSELISKGVVPCPAAVLTKDGLRQATMCDKTMLEFVRSLLAAGGLCAGDETEMARFAAVACMQQNLQKMIEELPGKPWVRSVQPADEAFNAAVTARDVVGIQLSLWRAVGEMANPSDWSREMEGLAATVDAAPGSYLWATASAEARRIVAGVQAGSAGKLRGATGAASQRSSLAAPTSARGRRLSRESTAAMPTVVESAQDTEEGDVGSTATDSFLHTPRSEAASERGARRMRQGNRDSECSLMSLDDFLAPGGSSTSLGDGDSDQSDEDENMPLEEEHSTSTLRGQQESIALSEPITESGYQNIANLCDTPAMAVFIRRVITEEGGEVMSTEELMKFSVWHSGERGTQNLEMLQKELVAQDWVHFGVASGGKLFMDRWYDGATKVLSFTESRRGNTLHGCQAREGEGTFWFDVDVQIAGLHMTLLFQPQVHALGTGTECKFSNAQEYFAITADHFCVRKQPGSQKLEVRLHHFQIDNLREMDQLHPIVLCPADSGYHSALRELSKQRRDATSFLYCAIHQKPSGILHLQELQFLMQPVIIRLDLYLWMEIGSILSDWVQQGDATTAEEDVRIAAAYIEELRSGSINVPRSSSSLQLVYLELLRLGAVIANVEILAVAKSKLKRGRSAAGVDDDAEIESEEHALWIASYLARLAFGSEGLLGTCLSALQSVVVHVAKGIGSGVLSGVGHVNPKFTFPETLVVNELSDAEALTARIVRSYVKAGMMQAWRVMFSTNLLGDPIGLGTSVTGGIVQFVRKTGSEIQSGDLQGEGLKSLAQGVVGGTFGGVGKIFGALGDTVDALSSSSDDQYMVQFGEVSHLGDGVRVGLAVLGHNTLAGLKGLYQRPAEECRKKGVRGVATGIAKGVVGLITKPVSGLMHGAQFVAEGVDATTHLLDKRGVIVPRRPRRPPDESLHALLGPELSPRTTIFIDSLRFAEEFLDGASFRVHLRAENVQQGSFEKHTRLGRLTPPGVCFEEVKWVPTSVLLGGDLIVEVHDTSLHPKVCQTSLVYTGRLPCSGPLAPLPRVAELLRHPSPVSLTHRERPMNSVRLPLQLHQQCTWRPQCAELRLHFWPAWDPETVPSNQRWVKQRGRGSTIDIPVMVLQPPPMQGMLEKKTKGAFHHWAQKWVTLINGELRYWEDRQACEQGRPPKVWISLRQSTCPIRFAAGPDPDAYFVQLVYPSGHVEARWRPAGGANRHHPDGDSGITARQWLQGILRHAMFAG